MAFAMDADNRSTRHRTLEGAFESASKARNEGAHEVFIRDLFNTGNMYESLKYHWERTTDGEYLRIKGTLTPLAIRALQVWCLKYSLPYKTEAHEQYVRID